MKMRIKNTAVKTVALLMVTLIAMLTFNQSVFIHTHQLNDGTVVTHAHPYNKANDSAPIKSHHHTLKEFLNLNHTTVLFLSLCIALASLWFSKHIIKYDSRSPLYQNERLSCSPGRAPPVFS